MSHLTIALLVVGAIVLVLGTIMVIRMRLRNRWEEMAPFRNYFGTEYDRDLLRQSSWCDGENLYALQTQVNVLNIRDRGASKRHSSGSGTTWRNRDRD
jgi:hypothetical protein